MNQFRTEAERIAPLTKKEEEAALGIDPLFRSVENSVYFDNYNLPCPILVTITTKKGENAHVVVRRTRHGDVNQEVAAFRALKEFGLPVPDVLVSPFQNEQGEDVAIYSVLAGENLQKLSMRSESGLQQAKELLIQAVTKLSETTTFMEKHEMGKEIPRLTPLVEFEAARKQDSPWSKDDMFQTAVKKLQPVLEKIDAPLVFSNGDYQPGNFLASNGVITGFLDFESPVFQDPLMGFVKYPIYDLFPLARTNIVETFLERTGFSKKDFASRLALGCLKILQEEISVSGGDGEEKIYRSRVLNLLNESISL